jgi:Zn-dependent protease with chaperone function
MNAPTDDSKNLGSTAKVTGWFYVIAALIPAMWVQGALTPHHRYPDPTIAPLVLTGLLIFLRAAIGLLCGQSSKLWWLYGSLYFLSIPIASAVRDVLFAN